MKQASAGLVALLASSRDLIFADIWSFNLKNGVNLNYASWDTDLAVAGTTFKSHDVLVTGGKFKQSRGLEVNETDVTCYPSLGVTTPASMVGGIPFLQGVRAGLFDRALMTRQRVFMPTPGDTSLGAVTLITGEVTDADVTRNVATLKCKDLTNLLNIYMPRRQYQPTCSWTFGDSNCTFNKAALTVASAVGAGSAGTLIYCGLGQGAGFFAYGTVKFTSGVNNGFSRAVKTYAPGVVTLTGPFPIPPAVGDAFNITPGCSKNLNGSSQQFNAAVTYNITPQTIPNNLGENAGIYNGYTLKFISGPLNGASSVISSWTPMQAVVTTPFNQSPNQGDEFQIIPPSGVGVTAVGTVISPISATVIPLGFPSVDGLFNNGTLQFTSGQNVGQTRTISSWAGGVATVSTAFPYVPVETDEVSITTATTQTQGTCTGYNNTINFGGQDQIPIPETAY